MNADNFDPDAPESRAAVGAAQAIGYARAMATGPQCLDLGEIDP